MAQIWTLHGDGRNVRGERLVGPAERLSWGRHRRAGDAARRRHVRRHLPGAHAHRLPAHHHPLLLRHRHDPLPAADENRLPSYLGSSFAFIAPIGAATASDGRGGALAGIVAVGLLLALVGLVVQVTGTGWIDALLPPVVAGAIVALIGFNLAPAARDNFVKAPLTR